MRFFGCTSFPWQKGRTRNMMISAADFVQYAGIAAILEGEKECQKMRDTYNKRRLFLLEKLKATGLDPAYKPEGAFYVPFKYPKQQIGSYEMAIKIFYELPRVLKRLNSKLYIVLELRKNYHISLPTR